MIMHSWTEGRSTFFDSYEEEDVEEWRHRGNLHREDGPAIIRRFFPSYTISSEQYYIHGVLHRPREPASLSYFLGGNLAAASYWSNGLRHRLDGPAHVRLNKDGEIELLLWCIYGVLLDNEEQYEQIVCMERAEMLMSLAKISKRYEFFGRLLEGENPKLSSALLAVDQLI